MNHDFTIVVRGDCTNPQVADALFDAFEDDPGVSSSGQISYIDLTIEAETLSQAVIRGLKQFMAAGTGLQAVDVLTETAMTLDRMAELLPFGYERLRQLQRGVQGPGGFPRPVISNGHRVQVWNWDDVRDWLTTHGLIDPSEVAVQPPTGPIEMIKAVLRLGDQVVGESADAEVQDFIRSYLKTASY